METPSSVAETPRTISSSFEDVFTYLQDYKVLICNECRFAVQPSALSSHLLRHHIYRGTRQRMVERACELPLAEPDTVATPSSTSAALNHLPIYNGWVCCFDDCQHACVASKRMSQHWREAHAVHHLEDVKARKGMLQTFFKGNKTKYFEVERRSLVTTPPTMPNTSLNQIYADRFCEVLMDTRIDVGSEDNSTGPEEPAINMRSLSHLCHWSATTSITLARGVSEPGEYWTKAVTSEAARFEFLMHSILGMSALHKAQIASANNERLNEARFNHSTALRYYAAGLAGFRNALGRGFTNENSVAFVATARLLGLQYCASIILEERLLPSSDRLQLGPQSILGPVEFLFLTRGSIEITISAQSLLPASSSFRLSDEALQALQSQPTTQNDVNIHPQLLLCVRTVESCQLIEADLAALRSAILALSLCWSGRILMTNDGKYAAWISAESWPRMISDQYIRLVQDNDPAALVIFSHWCVLLQQIEISSWYLKGHSERLVQIVLQTLKQQDGTQVIKFLRASLSQAGFVSELRGE